MSRPPPPAHTVSASSRSPATSLPKLPAHFAPSSAAWARIVAATTSRVGPSPNFSRQAVMKGMSTRASILRFCRWPIAISSVMPVSCGCIVGGDSRAPHGDGQISYSPPRKA